MLLVLMLGAGCATGGGAKLEEAPTFTRYRPYAPEELSREVVACAERVRGWLEADEASWGLSKQELRTTLYRDTVLCMRERGWKRG